MAPSYLLALTTASAALIRQAAAQAPVQTKGLGAGEQGVGPDYQDVWCKTPDICDETNFMAMPSMPQLFPDFWVDYTITPTEGYKPGSSWGFTGHQRDDIELPGQEKSWLTWMASSTRPLDGVAPTECTGVIQIIDPTGTEVARVDANNQYRMDLNLDGEYTMNVLLNDKCKYWHTKITYHSVLPLGGRRKPITVCKEGKFALELMVTLEDSYQMHASALQAVGSTLPDFVEGLKESFGGGVKVGFMSFGDKPTEPHGQEGLDYCVGAEDAIKLYSPLAPHDANSKKLFTDHLNNMNRQIKSGRDYMEDVLGALHYTTLTTPFSKEQTDSEGNRIVRVNLVITEKLWHEEGDSKTCTCLKDDWNDYECVQWVCTDAEVPPHPATAVKDCVNYDYLSRDAFADAMRANGVDTLVFLTSNQKESVLAAYESLGEYFRRYKGINLLAGSGEGTDMITGMTSLLDGLCRVLQKDDWNREDHCKDTTSFPFLPADILDGEDEGPMYSPGYLADRIRENALNNYPVQPFILK